MITVYLSGERHTTIKSLSQLAEVIALGDAPASDYTLDPVALKAQAADKIAAYAEQAGARLVAGLTPRRVAEYQIKAAIAADPSTASTEELALLDREAAARGIDRAALLARIAARAGAYRQITLMIAAMEAESYAALAAVPEDATMGAAIDALLAQLQATGEQAIADVRAGMSTG